jgi:hypothetical protein
MSSTHQHETKSNSPHALIPSGLLQRKCACGTHTIAGGECESCSKEKSSSQLQRSAASAEGVSEVPPIVHDVLRSSGQPLDAHTRSFFESRFDHDFSRVRVHTDTRAAESAHAVNALAYTVGRDIVFGAGQYTPGTNAGQRLLAHELTHAAQQGAVAYSGQRELTIGAAVDNHEQEADIMAARTGMAGAQLDHQFGQVRPRLQRQPKPPAKEEEKKPEIKITPATRTIPQAEAVKQLVPFAPAPTGLPDKSTPGKSTPSDKAEGPEIEASVEGSVAEQKITTNIEVGIPIKQFEPVLILGQPLVFNKELKFGVEVGAGPGPVGFGPQQQAAFKISYKALSYEIKSLTDRVKGLKEFGIGVTAEAGIDPAAPFARPDLGVKAELGAEYQIGSTPKALGGGGIFLKGSVGYEVTIPAQGPATAAPTADFGFKIEFGGR